jgi:hypothetical protein
LEANISTVDGLNIFTIIAWVGSANTTFLTFNINLRSDSVVSIISGNTVLLNKVSVETDNHITIGNSINEFLADLINEDSGLVLGVSSKVDTPDDTPFRLIVNLTD